MKFSRRAVPVLAALLLGGKYATAAPPAKEAAAPRSERSSAELPGLPPSPEASPFTDPYFQHFAEAAYGYRNPKTAAKLAGGYRDSLTSVTLAALVSNRPFAPATQDGRGRPHAVGERRGGGAALPAAGDGAAPVRYYKVTFADDTGPISAYVGPPGSGSLSGFRTGDHVFVSVFPKTSDHDAVIRSLSSSGFRYAGEKTYVTAAGNKTFLLGWVPYSRLEGVYKDPLVRRVAIEKKASGVPFRTRVRFTLRAPGGTRAGIFVSDFIRQLGAGFSSEDVSRLPNNSAGAKLTAFEVTGSLPVDMVGELSRSPFVAAVEFKDSSL